MRLRLGSGGSATLSVTGKSRHAAVMVPACSPGSWSSDQYCSRLKIIERPARLVSNLEQSITTLKSRMRGYHRLTMKRCAPRHRGSTLQKSFRQDQKDAHKLLAQIGAGRTTSDYSKNQHIFVQGSAADSTFFIQTGRVKVTVTSEHGKEAVVGILGEGQFFGEQCLSGQRLRTTSMTALTDCRITSITKAAMITAIRDHPRFAEFFIDHLLSRNSRIEEDVIDQLFNSSEKRLARLLLLLANYGKKGGPPIVPVTLKQETLAEMIGTTRSRVSFFMNKFRRLGLIDYNGKIDVHQSLLNSVLHDKPEIREDEPA
jgi:CRP/FNR family transcriptional regulator, cyclic AMP receptor protein